MEVLQVFSLRSDEHVAHEESMVGTSTDNPDSDAVLLVPSCEAVDDIDAVSCVQVINSSLSVDFPDLIIDKSASYLVVVVEYQHVMRGNAETKVTK